MEGGREGKMRDEHQLRAKKVKDRDLNGTVWKNEGVEGEREKVK